MKLLCKMLYRMALLYVSVKKGKFEQLCKWFILIYVGLSYAVGLRK